MTTNAVEYAQNAFAIAFRETEQARLPLRRSSIWRRFWAYGLKAMAVFGGLTIASGLFPSYAQVIGIAIAAAVALDGLFSNHVQMLLVTKAAHAFDRIAKQARRAHQLRLAPILALKETDPEQSRQQLMALLSKLTEQLQSGTTEIEMALSEGRIKALEGLNLDSERSKPTAAQAPAT
jgi:hypothetical protein